MIDFDPKLLSHTISHRITHNPNPPYQKYQDKHLPGYLAALPHFKAKGVDKIAVLAVNDFFAMKSWGKVQKVRIGFYWSDPRWTRAGLKILALSNLTTH